MEKFLQIIFGLIIFLVGCQLFAITLNVAVLLIASLLIIAPTLLTYNALFIEGVKESN